jgi:hypothetical protein
MWLPRSGVVVENLAVVARDLSIPAVLKLKPGGARNAIRDYRHYQPAKI